jgi:hypothetical protein
MHNPFLSPFSKVLTAALILSLGGLTGMAVIIFFTEPVLGPRWLAYFFLTLLTSGLVLPFVHVLQRRIATSAVPDSVLVREALWFGIFVDLIVWLQLGRVLNGLLAVFLAGGFIVLEMLLRLAETALFKPDAFLDE